MSNPKFKLSNIIPNTWFNKLKHINISSKIHTKPDFLSQIPPSSPLTTTSIKPPPRLEPHFSSRKSYHISRELTIDLPNDLDSLLVIKSPLGKSKSSTKSRKSSRRSSSISTCSCQSSSTFQSYHSKCRSPPSPVEETGVVKVLDDVGLLVEDALLKDNALGISKQSILNNNNALADDNHQPELKIQLPPIITKNKWCAKQKRHIINEQRFYSPPSRKMSIMSPGGVRLKTNSPRIVGRKQGQNRHKSVNKKSPSSQKRRSISESFAVVKSSFDPQKDFRESMVEMIQQHNLTAAKDLEDLLACFLSLNSDEYHHVIINVFKQIWIDFRHRK